MQIHMHKMLVVTALFAFSVVAADRVICHRCYSVRKDNKCFRPSTCTASAKQFCFIQRNSKGGHIMRIIQGCTTSCVDTIQFSNAYIRYTFCCKTNYCNKFNVWQFL